MTIPMPGHIVKSTDEIKQTKETVEKIEVNTLFAVTSVVLTIFKSLIDSHDVIFLLTDSRESRWLPTMLCAAKNKVPLHTHFRMIRS